MRMRSGRLAVIAVVVVAVVGTAVPIAVRTWSGDDSSLPPDVGVVDWVVDGDTVDVVIAGRTERVRLIGINTPEIGHDGQPAECYGPEAADFTAAALPEGIEVRLVRDVVGRDDYGRLLAYIYRRSDGDLINETIIAGGYARPLTIEPNNAYADRFVAAATAAEAAGLGLWGACAG